MVDKETKSYHKTIVWQKLKELLIITYKLTEKLPKSEEFGLKSQMKRAVVSTISNFVEGYLKRSAKEKSHFMKISKPSLLELEAKAEICLYSPTGPKRIMNSLRKKEHSQVISFTN